MVTRNWHTVEPIGRPGASPWAINHFFHLDDDDTPGVSLWWALETWRPIRRNNMIPFAKGGGGNLFFLDLATSPPAVKVCVHDGLFAVVDIAPSLETFIDALFIDLDDR